MTAALVGFACFALTVAVAAFVTGMARVANAKDAAKADARAARIQRQLDAQRDLPRWWLSCDDDDYMALRNYANSAEGKPYDQHPLSARLAEAAADGLEPRRAVTTNAYAPAPVAASPSLVDLEAS